MKTTVMDKIPLFTGSSLLLIGKKEASPKMIEALDSALNRQHFSFRNIQATFPDSDSLDLSKQESVFVITGNAKVDDIVLQDARHFSLQITQYRNAILDRPEDSPKIKEALKTAFFLLKDKNSTTFEGIESICKNREGTLIKLGLIRKMLDL